MVMIIVGLTGPIGHGKTSFAAALAQHVPNTLHLESSMIIAEVANRMHKSLVTIPDPYNVDSLNGWLKFLPEILEDILGVSCSFDHLKLSSHAVELHPIEYQKLILHVENLQRNPHLAREDITIENKESYRPFLQWLGGYCVLHIDPTIWYNEIIRRINAVQKLGANLVIVGGLRFPSDANLLRTLGAHIVKIYRPGYLQNDMLDPTERERENIRSDCTVINNGTLEDFDECAQRFIEDLHKNKLQDLYKAKMR